MSAASCVGRKSAVEEEDASELRLGADFADAHCLSMAEVKIVQTSKLEDDAERGEETFAICLCLFKYPRSRRRRFFPTLGVVF